nr:MazG-like family protein [Gracilibacillus dipsosauri]
MDKLTGKIEEWAIIRELDRALPEKQMLKLQEEVGELAAGLARGDLDKVVDSIGDVYVVITILSMQLGLDIEECIEEAYKEIKDRTGQLVDGVYVKSEDL